MLLWARSGVARRVNTPAAERAETLTVFNRASVSRALGPATPIAASTEPSGANTGTATDDMPSSSSSTEVAYPCLRTAGSNLRNCCGSLMVRLARCDRGGCQRGIQIGNRSVSGKDLSTG